MSRVLNFVSKSINFSESRNQISNLIVDGVMDFTEKMLDIKL